MNDLVRPTAVISGARVPAIGPSGVLGTVPNPPPQLAQLSVGSTLAGVVVGHDAEGHTLVRTDLGTLSVATKAQLPVKSEVTLHIRSSGGQLIVLIVHSELPPAGAKGGPAPQPPQSPSTQVGSAQVGSTQVGGAQVGGTGPQGQIVAAAGAGQAATAGHGPAADFLTLGQHLRAVVQSPAAAPNAAAGPAVTALAAQLVPGSELHLRIVSVQAPTVQPGGTQAASGSHPAGPLAAGPLAAAPLAGGPPPGGLAGGAPVPGATAPSVPGGTSGPPGGSVPFGILQSGSSPGQAVSPALPGVAATGPNPAAVAPPSAVPVTPIGQGTPTGAAVPATGTPAPGIPASGAIASYAAAGGSSGAAALVSDLSAAANPAALLAAHGIGRGGGPIAHAPASQPGMAPGINTAGTPGGTPGSAPASATPPTPNATPAPGAASGAASGAIPFAGTVTAINHAGQPILQTPLGTLTLEIRAPLQAGSRIAFELPSGALSPPGPGAAGSGPAPLATLAHSWPALDETLRVLQEVAPPGVAAAMLQDAIPQPGSRLASGLLFFLSALSGGDVTRWIGNQATQALKNAGRDSLLSRLGRDFSQLGRLADNEGGDWRLFFIPIHDGDQQQQLRLFLRNSWRDGDGDPDQDDEDTSRFVVEVEMSHLGELQLDGLVREKRLDLILRSRAPLPDFMRRDITQIFHEANEITGNRGSIGFQSSLEWKAMPIEAPEVAADAGVLV